MAEAQPWGRVPKTKGQGLAARPETGPGAPHDKTRYPRWTEAMVDALPRMRAEGRKWFQLYDKFSDERTLRLAWERINARVSGEARRRGAGIDGVTVEDFARDSEAEIKRLAEAMRKGEYKPSPVRRLWIPKPGSNRKRPLGLPTVADRVVQEALRGVIEPVWEEQFLDGSHGFRPGRSTDTACLALESQLLKGNAWVVDADIRGCFDNIAHKAVIELLHRHVADGKILKLAEAMLKAGVMEDMQVRSTATGAPQGGVISPLLCNIVLHELDRRLDAEGIAWVRYADDFVLPCPTREQAERARDIAAEALAPLGLELHPDKTRIVHLDEGFDFLGWHYKGERRWPRDKSEKAIRGRIREKTRRNRPDSIEKICAELTPILRGVFSFFRNGNSAYTFQRMDGYTRRRLRGILKKRTKGGGISGGLDHFRWPNAFFGKAGLFELQRNLTAFRAGTKPCHSPTGG